MELKSQPTSAATLLVLVPGRWGSPVPTLVASLKIYLPAANCFHELKMLSTPAPYRVSRGADGVCVQSDGLIAPFNRSAFTVRISVAAVAVPLPPSPRAPAWARIAAAPETCGVEKLVAPAGAVRSGFERPLSGVGPTLEVPP